MQPQLIRQLPGWLLQVGGIALIVNSMLIDDLQSSRSSGMFKLGFALFVGGCFVQRLTPNWQPWLPGPLLFLTLFALVGGFAMLMGETFALLPESVILPGRGMVGLSFVGMLAALIAAHVRRSSWDQK